MSTETDTTNPETGVGGQGQAPSDDIDTEAFDRMEAPDDDGEDTDQANASGEGEGGDDTDADPDKPNDDEDDPDTDEVEYEGQKFRVPKPLKDAILRHADYTRKTQEVAEIRRTLDEERTTWETQREESRAALPEEHQRVAILSHRLQEVEQDFERPIYEGGPKLRDIDWASYAQRVQGLPADDPQRATYAQLRDAYQMLRDRRLALTDDLSAAKNDLSAKETARLKEQQEAAEADLAKRRQETGQVLAKEIPGWNADLAKQTAVFMHDEFGVTAEEIGEATDPRLWKMAHGLMTERAKVAKLEASLKQHNTAKNHEKAQGAKPAESNKGTGAASARDPSTARGDGLSMDEWMRRRQAQKAKA